MRVVKQILAPGVQHGEESDFSSQMLRIAGNCLQGLRSSVKKNVVEHRFVVVRDGRDLLGQGENDVEIRRGKELGLAVIQPLGASQ